MRWWVVARVPSRLPASSAMSELCWERPMMADEDGAHPELVLLQAERVEQGRKLDVKLAEQDNTSEPSIKVQMYSIYLGYSVGVDISGNGHRHDHGLH